MRQTKIICTVGPATASAEMLRKIIEAGADVLRLNFSHGNPAQHRETAKRIRTIADQLRKPVAILQDLPGPKIRIGALQEGNVQLHAGDLFTLTTAQISGNGRKVSVSYDGLPDELCRDQVILLADGAIELKVEDIKGSDIACRVIVGGCLSSHKGVNLPGSAVRLAAFTGKDREFLSIGLEMGVDIVALSFVRSPADVLAARQFIDSAGADTPIMVKVEKPELLDHIDEVIELCDSVMVARGDLGVEISLANVPIVQKDIIARAVRAGKPVVTATQMLRSMVESSRPTRAEVADAANAVLDGSDALMLSEESAVGAYPVEAVQMLAQVAEIAGQRLIDQNRFAIPAAPASQDAAEAIGHAACMLARESGAAAIVCCGPNGRTARLIAKHRPATPIIAASSNAQTVRRMMLIWGVQPVPTQEFASTESMLDAAVAAATASGLVAAGSHVVVAAGALPRETSGEVGFVRILRIP